MQTEGLRVNLARTAVDVGIPAEHQVLLEISEHLYGVHADTERLLKEIHHTYAGWAQTLPELHRRAMADLYHCNQHPRGPEGVQVFCDLYAKAVAEAPSDLQPDAVRHWLAYLNKIVRDSGDRLDANLPAVDASLDRIARLVEASDVLAAEGSPGLRRLAAALTDLDAATARHARAVYAGALDRVYARWLGTADPEDWYRELRPDGPLPDAVAAISHRRLTDLRRRLDPDDPDALLTLPDHAAVVRAHLTAADTLDDPDADRWQNLQDRATWMCRLLAEDLTAPVHDQALWAIARSCRTIVASADDEHIERFVREVFATVHDAETGSPAAALDLVLRLGQAMLATGHREGIDRVIDEIIGLDFHRPGFTGFTAEWGAKVDPNHLRNIRAYLGVIETDPRSARRLLAALIVHLRLGGVFVADTDLFQRDISRLLSADIGPVYQKVRQLLRLFPVYFNDIGAEGDLRRVSTRLDENRERKDPLCHFLRKQSHVDSTPVLVSAVTEVVRFWATGDPEPLRDYLPPEVFDRLDPTRYVDARRILHHLADDAGGIDALLDLDPADAWKRVEAITDADPLEREQVGLLLELHHHLAAKYRLDHADLMDRLRASHHIHAAEVDALEADLAAGNHLAALSRLVGFLETLQGIILDPRPTEIFEDIYHKRHIAAGIPSMYGRYREERFEALGLSFRVESLAGALFDRLVADAAPDDTGELDPPLIAELLRLLERALLVEGYEPQGLALALSMFEEALAMPSVSLAEYVDIFRFVSRSVRSVVRTQVIAPFDSVFDTIARRLIARGELPTHGRTVDETVIRATEAFLRDLIGEGLALQRIDALTGRVLRTITAREGARGGPMELVPLDPDRCLVPIADAACSGGIVRLGNKGYMLARMARAGIPVPPGFILTTDLFRSIDPDDPHLPDVIVDRIRDALHDLERRTGSRLGDPERPLLLAVRGGAPISMPGMLDTFLNVGIDPTLADGFARARRSPWAAWDAYRRYLQAWGMSHGIDRDDFDQLMAAAKARRGVPKKALLAAEDMRDLAFGYRDLLVAHGVPVDLAPFDQLVHAVERVLASWRSDKARVYRGELQIADGWGTAVIVETMVYGNLDDRSGTGVVLTRNPHRTGDRFELYGDFIIQGQGDDVVSGLVETFPVTPDQRPGTVAERSLATEFPDIYTTLERWCRTLVSETDLPHQEVEFTFESPAPEDLFILQAREAIDEHPSEVATFVPTPDLDRALVATGIGVGGGAFSGRVAYDVDTIADLRRRHPDDPVLLVRPDTVPDDIHLLFQADGLLTAVGGATSHAAVVAARLGKPCVVGCRGLVVKEEAGSIVVDGRHVATGEFLSINGSDGSVYAGRHPVTMIPVGEAVW